MKKTLALLTAIVMMLLLVGCGSSQQKTESTGQAEQKADAGKLVIYSPNQDDEVNALIPLFEQETGIKVVLQSMGTGDVLARIAAEKENPQADVNWGAINLGFYKTNPDLWEKYVSVNDEKLPEEYRNTTGFITSYKLSGSAALLLNTEVFQELGLNPDEFKGYADLLRPELKGHIAMGDATASSSAYAELTNMLTVMGDKAFDDKAWEFVDKFVQQLNGTIISSSSQIYKGTADGEYAVGVSYEDPCITLLENGAPNIKLVYPQEGCVWLPGGSAIVKNAPNMENAKKFMDFLQSDSAQKALAGTTIRTINPKFTNESKFMKPFSELNQVFEDLEYTSEHKSEFQEKWLSLVNK